MYFTGIIIAAMTFLTIGLWHPIVIKTEYYFGTRPWVIYLLVGISCCVAALFISNVYISSFLGVFGASALWGIGVARFDEQGNAKALTSGTGDRTGSTFSFVYILTFCKTSQHGSHWQKTFAIWQYQVLSIEAIFMRYSMHEAKKQKAFLITSENCWGGVTGFSLL